MTKTYENIRKNATGRGDDYTTDCLLDYSYFKENYKMSLRKSFANNSPADIRLSKTQLRDDTIRRIS